MRLNLAPYANKRICVAVSGGRDSMALLHYLCAHAEEYAIQVSALNCDHGIRGGESERDSTFVRQYCGVNGIPLHFYKWDGNKFEDESAARFWRLCCYNKVIEGDLADLIATAHHMNDNAETVLFNLARGSSLSGLTGITDTPVFKLVRPLINCTRDEIDEYISENAIPFVTDSTNLSDEYTRNKIRRSVLPALEAAVPGAVKNIFRFSRLAAEDEEYFGRKSGELIVKRQPFGYLIKPCGERVIFKRAAHTVIAVTYGKKDYTAEHFERLFALQSMANGKKFEFLGLTAVKEDGGVAICDDYSLKTEAEGMPFLDNFGNDQMYLYCGRLAFADCVEYLSEAMSYIVENYEPPFKILKYDLDCLPPDAVIRFRREGDKFTKFGGGTKKLGDYLTDKKVPQSMRATLPLICSGSEVLIVGGVEISEKVKVTAETERVGVFVCHDPLS